MEEALELGEHLPNSYANAAEGQYVAFLWNTFETNYTNEKYEFASLAFHLLYMSYVSFSIWQIRLAREREFRGALIGFQSDAEQKLLTADSPFKFYEQLKESQIFRFLKLVGCANDQVGEFSKFVKRRNKIAHPTGTVFFNDKAAIDDEIGSMMREVVNIQNHMKPVILDIYAGFLRQNHDPEVREYPDDASQIREILVHENYMSQKDMEFCADFDVAQLADDPNFAAISTLHAAVREVYGAEREAVG